MVGCCPGLGGRDMRSSRRLSEYRIARELGEAVANRLVNACIRELQRMGGEFLLSGDCSGLRNVWDEICVQEQLENSCSWHAYLETIAVLIECRLEELPLYEQEALWLLTPEGDEWDSELEDERDAYPVVSEHLAAYVQNELLSRALDWRNERISRYLAHRHLA